MFGIYWTVNKCRDDSNFYSETEYTQLQQTKGRARKTATSSPTLNGVNSYVFKKILRMNYNECADDDFDITRGNASVVAIGAFHAKQASLYQSFETTDENGYQQFTQLSSYNLPQMHAHVTGDEIEQEKRIETFREMLQSPQKQGSVAAPYYGESSDQEDYTSASDNEK
eukprot:CAMPEP_0202698408 /NCGR_PEP_ID=MMETSP1385-20130828/11701_1 /ASSEMBLY_ACC=CAM_ASM_000861 /TAXON_ID=933848 /ORGANISM="Elphidium margaritaceum" /LENGTH=168 /DNA_ID=CAMNT_0049355123 /DNA_START=180 /DNA_END=686 /DNA_ORIENTATION=-